MNDLDKGVVFYKLLVEFLVTNNLCLIGEKSKAEVLGVDLHSKQLQIGIGYVSMKEVEPIAIKFGENITGIASEIMNVESEVEKTRNFISTTGLKTWVVTEFKNGAIKCTCPIFKRTNICHHVETHRFTWANVKPKITTSKSVSTPILIPEEVVLIIPAFNISKYTAPSALTTAMKETFGYMICVGYTVADIKNMYPLNCSSSELYRTIEYYVGSAYDKISKK